MPRPEGLQRRRQVWFVRVGIPSALRPHFDGKTEIIRTLGTSDFREACQRVRLERLKIDEEFTIARRKAEATAASRAGVIKPAAWAPTLDGLPRVDLTDTEIHQLVAVHLHTVLRTSWAQYLSEGPSDEAADLAGDDAALADDEVSVQQAAKALLYDRGIGLVGRVT